MYNTKARRIKNIWIKRKKKTKLLMAEVLCRVIQTDISLFGVWLPHAVFLLTCFTHFSGKTEYQTTKTNKARRSTSFERRPSKRYSRRTLQMKGDVQPCPHTGLSLLGSLVPSHLLLAGEEGLPDISQVCFS